VVDCKTKGNTVLVVDDEPFIRDVVSMMIEGLGFAVLVAADGSEGVQLVEKHRQEIFLVICDLSMPGMDGWQTITALRAIAPELPVALASGHRVDAAMCREHPDQPWVIMNKPYVFEALNELVQRALLEGASIT
jgi:two-component system, cell cycle sensor histidine kinase and response regulator CckA